MRVCCKRTHRLSDGHCTLVEGIPIVTSFDNEVTCLEGASPHCCHGAEGATWKADNLSHGWSGVCSALSRMYSTPVVPVPSTMWALLLARVVTPLSHVIHRDQSVQAVQCKRAGIYDKQHTQLHVNCNGHPNCSVPAMCMAGLERARLCASVWPCYVVKPGFVLQR